MRAQLASALLLSLTLMMGFPASSPSDDSIGGGNVLLGNDGKTVTAAGTQTHRGSKTTPGTPGNRGGHARPRAHGNTPVVGVNLPHRNDKPQGPPLLDRVCLEWTSYSKCLYYIPQPGDPKIDPKADPQADPQAVPTFTISDLASFGPAAADLMGEPDNLGVAGLPTNFVADAAAHTRSGTLFGYPLTARFTPASFTFEYGDGRTATARTAGQTWESLGLPPFSPTDTSHVYAERGTYTARAHTTYTAEIDLGTGWIPLSGTLTIPGPPQEIRIFEARTALVAHTCTENPQAAGC